MSKVLDGPSGGAPDHDYAALRRVLTGERLGSYMTWSHQDLKHAFALYEWNLIASAAVMMTTGMVEVVVRNAMDQAMQELAVARGWPSWFDSAPLDARGRADIAKARQRATRFGTRPEAHGKVVAELSLGFWRYLAASRYLTTLWTPALYRAFAQGPADKLQCQRRVDKGLQTLLLVRNRAAHHEPIHRRDLRRDLETAIEVTRWVDPRVGEWVRDLSTLDAVITAKPSRPTA